MRANLLVLNVVRDESGNMKYDFISLPSRVIGMSPISRTFRVTKEQSDHKESFIPKDQLRGEVSRPPAYSCQPTNSMRSPSTVRKLRYLSLPPTSRRQITSGTFESSVWAKDTVFINLIFILTASTIEHSEFVLVAGIRNTRSQLFQIQQFLFQFLESLLKTKVRWDVVSDKMPPPALP